MRTRVALTAASVLLAACEGQPAPTGLDEPMQVLGGQFIEGALPYGAGPSVAPAGFNNQVVTPGAGAKSVSGLVDLAASSVGVRFADLGTGYWVVPAAEPDSQSPGERAFRFTASFNADDPAGLHPMRFVAIDGAGRAGGQSQVSLCIASRVPDNLHACVPSAAPPNTVLSLRWDTNFDLDLHVVTPDGRDINPKMPVGADVPANTMPDAGAPRIDRDSLGACVADGLRQEDLVFQSAPPPGTYQVRVDPFAACGQSAARFVFTEYRTTGVCPGCSLAPTVSQAGELLSSQVTGGASVGLFVADVSF